MTRPSEHNNEWVVMTPVQPDPDEAPTGYRCHSLPVDLNEAGQLVTPDPVGDWPAAEPGQADIQTLLDVQVDNGTRITRNRVKSSNRAGIPTEWRTTVTATIGGAVICDIDWCVRGAGPRTGNGAAINANERFVERWPNEEEFGFHHNPNMGGHGNNDTFVDDPRSYGGKILYYSASGNRHTCGMIPVDFGGDPGNNAISDHGGDGEFNPMLWWQHRMYQDLQLHYEGDANCHKVTFWSYVPKEWSNRGVSDPMLAIPAVTNAIIALRMREAWIIDMTTGVQTPVADWEPPGGVPPLIDTFFHDWGLTTERFHKDNATVISPSPAPDGKVGALLHDPVTGFALGFACALAPTDDILDCVQELGTPRANILNLQNFVPVDSVIDDVRGNYGASINMVGKSITKRPRGWLGFQYFIVTGTKADVEAALLRITANGWLDEPIEPPNAETIGDTQFPTPVAA